MTNPIHAEVRQRLAQYGEVVMNPLLEPWQPNELAEHLSTATAMMGFMTDRVDAVLLAQAPQLKIVACALKGFDNYVMKIDGDAAKPTITLLGTDTLKANMDFENNMMNLVFKASKKSNDNINLVIDGTSSNSVIYGTGLLFGDGYIYGQGAGSQSVEGFSNIKIVDDFNYIAFGSDIYNENISNSRLDNIRLSRINRNTIMDVKNNFIDLN